MKGYLNIIFFDDKINWEEINEAFSLINWETEFDGLEANDMANHLISMIETICSRYAPQRTNEVCEENEKHNS